MTILVLVKLKLSIAIGIALLLIGACSQNNTQSALTDNQNARAQELLEAQCYTCHRPSGGPTERLAPPMYAVQKHYLNHYSDQGDFVAAFTAYVNHPDSAKSKMPGALKRFGLMPKMSLAQEDLALIAKYVYQTTFEKPGWFDKHKKEQNHESTNTISADLTLPLGKEIALSTKAALGQNLMKAINRYGTAGAVDFCNTQALPIKDSMAQLKGYSIKRVSDQPRNPLNAANEAQLAYINETKQILANGGKPKPYFDEIGKTGYYPIVTNNFCLQCHGSEIDKETLKTINTKYPNDKAQGYKSNELRGIWVISQND